SAIDKQGGSTPSSSRRNACYDCRRCSCLRNRSRIGGPVSFRLYNRPCCRCGCTSRSLSCVPGRQSRKSASAVIIRRNITQFLI
ncbi:hypothetical protein PMAYCL1PPCAC_20906, partial [Pristionchus mayeri]